MFRKTAMLLFVGVVLGIIVLAGCHIPLGGKVSSSGGSSGGSSAASSTTATGILSNLGVKEVSSPPAATITTQSGETVSVDPSTWQPLKTKYAVFTPKSELFQAGGSAPPSGSTSTIGDGSLWNSFYENGASNYTMTSPFIGTSADQTWEKSAAKISVAADLTGDGVDNIVVFYVNSSAPTQLNDIVYSPPTSGSGVGTFGSPHTVTALTLNSTPDVSVAKPPGTAGVGEAIGMGTPWFPYFSCTKADLNGDGIDEILLTDYETLYILSVDPATGAVSVRNTISEVAPISSVAAGDYNGDGKDDFVVCLQGTTTTNQPEWLLYDSQGAEVGSPYLTNGGVGTSPVEATFGNFGFAPQGSTAPGASTQEQEQAAGQGQEKLAVCVEASDGYVLVQMYDFEGANWTPTAKNYFHEAYNPYDVGSPPTYQARYYRMLPRAVDLHGTGQDALFVLGSIYDQPMTTTDSGSTPAVPTYRIGPSASGISSVAAPLYNTDNTMVDVQVGLMGSSSGGAPKFLDPQQDLVVLCDGTDGVPDIAMYGLDGSGNFSLLKKFLTAQLSTALQSIDPFGTSTTIAVGNFQNDSPRVEYAGHKLTFTNPVVIAALASPPYWSDIVNSDPGYANSYSGWNTTYGEETAHSSDSTTSVGFSVGAEVKFEDDVDIFGIKAASFESSVSFQNTNTWEFEQSAEVSKSIQYNCPGGENLVIFTAVPEDQYQYQVVSTTDQTNNPIGSSLYIVIPRAFNTYVVTQAFFNSHINPSIVLPISDSAFGTINFTIGDPSTYPSTGLAQTIMNGAFGALQGWSSYAQYYQIAEKPVAEGTNNISGGSTNLQIAMSTGTERTITHDFEMDTSVGGGAGGLSVLANAGFQTGYSTSSAVSKTTTFGGTVGYLPDTYYNNPNYFYDAGLFVYPYKQLNGTTFWVVSYDVN